jgi:Xaa-Pro aminopeptidase
MDFDTIRSLRSEMESHEVDYYITSSSDPHLSEYPADFFNEKKVLTGFEGSYGITIVDKQQIYLWTDIRYHIEAESLSRKNGFVLMKQGVSGVTDWKSWVTDAASDGKIIGLNFSNFSANEIIKLEQMCDETGAVLKDTGCLFLHTGDYSPCSDELFSVEDDFSVVLSSRLRNIRNNLFRNKNNNILILTALDDIAWLTGLRSTDVLYNPVFYAYMIVSDDKSYIFCNQERFSSHQRAYFSEAGIELKSYSIDSLKNVVSDLLASGDTTLYFSKERINAAVYNFLLSQKLRGLPVKFRPAESFYIERNVKTEEELEKIDLAALTDGVALTLFLQRINRELLQGINEFQAGKLIGLCRKEAAERTGCKYFFESFEPISAWGPNGAIIHYKPDHENSLDLRLNLFGDELLLLDSGGQYDCGTTDITRVFALGKFSKQAAKDYSLVLKGHLDLKNAIFPGDIESSKLDSFARMHLWQNRMDYGHGTGHGIGFFLNVHEGPAGIRRICSDSKLYPGMVLSNEPGFYRENKYGIRIENMLSVEHDREGFLRFRDLTYFPYEKKLMDTSILGKDYMEMINSYHKKIIGALKPFLSVSELKLLKSYCL